MKLFREIVDLGKDLIEKYSLVPVDVDEARIYLVRSRSEILEVCVWRGEVELTLYRDETTYWAGYSIGNCLLEDSRSGEFIFEYGRMPKESLSEKEVTLLFVNKFLFEILRRAGDRLFCGTETAWEKDYRWYPSFVSTTQAALLERTAAKYLA